MECDHQFVSTERKRAVTPGGLVAVVLVLCGLVSLLINPLLGVLVIIAAVLIGMIGRRKTVIVCARCGADAPHQP